MAPRIMKIGLGDSKAYFRINPSCHTGGVTQPNMKIGRRLGVYFRIKGLFPIIGLEISNYLV
jgi:hypothetical protein